MANLKDYFESRSYKPKYYIGDRVFGKYNKIPFVGSVGNDTLVREVEGPYITVHLDLPIKYENKIHTVIIGKHKDVQAFK